MSETTSSSEPATGPVATAEPPPEAPVAVEPRRHGRLNAVAAWVGIVAGVVFIVAVIFFSGFVLGAHSGGDRGGGHGGRDHGFMMHRDGPPPMFQMGPGGNRPWPPGGPGGPGGPNFEGPSQPSGPSSSTAPRP
jgi:hypothetical protein